MGGDQEEMGSCGEVIMEELEALKEKRPKLACLLHLGLMQHEPLTTCHAGARTTTIS